MTDEIVQLLQLGDTYAAVQRVQRDGSTRDIATRFVEIVGELYWKKKNLGAVVAMAQGGMHYCLTKMAESTGASNRDFFGSYAKRISFNLGSFAWPGWDEPGISPSTCELAAGLNAAKLNLRLATELGKPLDSVQSAHSLLGAHLLAVNDPAGALGEFEQSNPQTRPLFGGYALLAQIMLGISGAQASFDDHLANLPAENDEERAFNRSQLVTSYRVFVDRRS